MRFVEAIKSVIPSGSGAVRRPEMVGYVEVSVSSRTLSVTVSSVSAVGTLVGGVSGTYAFEHDGTSWKLNGSAKDLSSAFSVTGTPRNGDSFSVKYASGTTPSAVVESVTVSGLRDASLSFRHWGTPEGEEEPVGSDTPVISCIVDTDSSSVVSVTGVTSFTSPKKFCVSSYFMSALLVDDWFVSSVADAGAARSSTY